MLSSLLYVLMTVRILYLSVHSYNTCTQYTLYIQSRYIHILKVVYGLCLSKASVPGDCGDHTVVLHLFGGSSQLYDIGKMYDTSSRMDGAGPPTEIVCPTTQVSLPPGRSS